MNATDVWKNMIKSATDDDLSAICGLGSIGLRNAIGEDLRVYIQIVEEEIELRRRTLARKHNALSLSENKRS